ncbi:programmed cell death protein 2-like [Cylas formicarius]|uniref:programmed cell death protein 2-like n=1 Tax=Cylas formicarius TaxID=197179 RepID=UPI00295849D7|nr:programmed cell death protein 2-like [Cylas formicarius]
MSKSKTLLGFEDEFVTDTYKALLNHTTNKIGGKPDFPNVNIDNPNCELCRLPLLLVCQIYAPLDVTYDRTLYLFGCINAKCWNSGHSWTCLRVQVKKTDNAVDDVTCSSTKSFIADWCADADNWGEDNIDDNFGPGISSSTVMQDPFVIGIANLSVGDPQDEQIASAEIDLEENELVRVDTPPTSEIDIGSLLRESVPPPLPPQTSSPEFLSFFLSVWEEDFPRGFDQHAEQLLLKYREKNDLMPGEQTGSGGVAESYEKSFPAHGDKMFHQFISKIREHPGQLLRYSREGNPLLLYPLKNATDNKCLYCQEESVFEFQLLSTIIPKLRLTLDDQACARLDFGTVLVYTCKNSCWKEDAVFQTETVIVQHEKY